MSFEVTSEGFFSVAGVRQLRLNNIRYLHDLLAVWET